MSAEVIPKLVLHIHKIYENTESLLSVKWEDFCKTGHCIHNFAVYSNNTSNGKLNCKGTEQTELIFSLTRETWQARAAIGNESRFLDSRAAIHNFSLRPATLSGGLATASVGVFEERQATFRLQSFTDTQQVTIIIMLWRVWTGHMCIHTHIQIFT